MISSLSCITYRMISNSLTSGSKPQRLIIYSSDAVVVSPRNTNGEKRKPNFRRVDSSKNSLGVGTVSEQFKNDRVILNSLEKKIIL